MNQPRKIAKPARGQLYPSVVSTYICTGTAVEFGLYTPGTSIFFIWGHVHSCTVYTVVTYIYICV